MLIVDRRPAVAGLVVRHPPGVAVLHEAGEELTAIAVRESRGQVAIEPQQIEGDEHHRHLDREALDVVRVLHVHPALQPLEARPAAVVERDDLAVEQRGVPLDALPASACSSG